MTDTRTQPGTTALSSEYQLARALTEGRVEWMRAQNADHAYELERKVAPGRRYLTDQQAADLAEGRVEAWRRDPDLVTKSRQQHFSDPISESGETVADRIGQVVRDAADRAVRKSGVLWTDWGKDQQQARVKAQARAAAWRTEEGRLLRDLATAYGGVAYPSGVAKIKERRDGDRFDKALRILADGFDL